MDITKITQDFQTWIAAQHGYELSAVLVNKGQMIPLGNPSAIYPIASCTKAMTAWLIWQLTREGHVELGAPLSRHVPSLSFRDPDATENLTILDALVHRSGLPPHTWAWVYLDVDRETFFRERLPHLEPEGPYAEAYRYSNILYGALGLACGDWEQQIQDRLWKPLDMQNTYHLQEGWHKQPGVVLRTNQKDDAVIFHAQERHAMAPSGEVMSCTGDMAKWLHFLLGGDHEALWRPEQFIRNSNEGPLHYGLGWRVETVAGQRTAWHTGGCTGYSSLCVLVPDEDLGICLLSNGHGIANNLKDAVFSMLRKTPPKNLPAFGTSEDAKGPVHESPITGRFHHSGYGSLTVDSGKAYLNGYFAGYLTAGKLWLSDYGFDVEVEIRDRQIILHYPGSPTTVPFVP